MVQGLAMFYGGLVRTKNVLGTMMHSFVSIAIIGVLWVVCGYSLTFGKSIPGGFVGWSSDYFFLRGIDDTITSGVPEYVLAMFQGKFAIIAPALISGALAARVYFKGYTIFIVLWFLLIYCPLCHWVWASDGWLFNAGAGGVIDLAGGLVIHVSAGISALVAALYLGPCKGFPRTGMAPNNLVMTMMGTLSSMVCYWALNLKLKIGYDDSLDCFGIHGVGSGLGVLLLSFFIRESWMMAAASDNIAGWDLWDQLLVQVQGMGATIALAAVGTLVICVLIEKCVGLRIDEQGEYDGLDQSMHSENGYGLIFPEAR